MVDNALVAVPVTNPAGAIIGVLTDMGLLRCFLKRSQATPNLIFLGNYSSEFEKIQTIGEDEPLTEAFRKMVASTTKRIFVLREDKIVGRLEPADLYEFMASKGPSKRFKGNLDESKKALLPRTTATEAALYQATLFREAPCPMFSCDLSGVILAANQMLHFLLDYHDGELVGHSVRELFGETFHGDLFDGLDKVATTGYFPWVNMAWVMKSTELLKITVCGFLRHNQEGIPHSVVFVGRLETDQEMNDKLSKAAVSQAARRKSSQG